METTEDKTTPQVDEMKLITNGSLCHACGRTGVGGRKENQDAYGGIGTDQVVVLTVCDGMGGMAGGQVASMLAAQAIINTLKTVSDEQMNADHLRQAIRNANTAVYQRAAEEPILRGMGTTATVLVLTRQAAFLTHVGDSRIYQLRKGKKVFRTFDHSKVFEMVARGLMTEEQARQSSFSNIITQALGIRPTIDVEVQMVPFKAGDRFVLCCDGIWNTEPEPDLLQLFTAEASPEQAIVKLTDHVNSKGIERGGEYDNLTAIMADVKVDSHYQYSLMHKLKHKITNTIHKRTDK